MEWTDEGYVLAARSHGESSLILSVLTETQGRHRGLVRGGAGRRKRGQLQVGNRVHVTWRGRLAEHLGSFTVEPVTAHAAAYLDSPDALAFLNAACAVAEAVLPEREPHPAVFRALAGLLGILDDPDAGTAYVKWELGVLGDLGFGLDLEACAATGLREDLVYVSPKSGRAVSRDAGRPYHDALLTLPGFVREAGGRGDAQAVLDGLALTGYFLERHALDPRHPAVPARERLVERLRRRVTDG